MIAPLHQQRVLDLSSARLDPGWLRRRPTEAAPRERVTDDVWCTGPQLQFRRILVEALDQAHEVALLCSFLLADRELADAMLRAAERGVRVYVLSASEQRIRKAVREEDDFAREMAMRHEQLLDALGGKVLLRSAEHIHAKFLVVDPGPPNLARAWLSTANFNQALADNLELGVRLDGSAARALAGHFCWAFWCEAQRELRGPGRLIEITPKQPAVPPRPEGDAVLATLSDRADLRERVVSMIRGARREILIATYGLDAHHPSVDALVEAAERGVRVTLFTRPRRAVADGVARLAAAGASVLAHDKLHAKALVADGQALVMSANLEPQGLDAGFEVGALLPAEAARAVEQTLRGWAATFPWVYRSDATRGEHLGDYLPAVASLREGVLRVTESFRQVLPAVIGRDALALADTPAPPLTAKPPPGELPQRVVFEWDVVPTLPKGAKERPPPRG